MSELGTIKERLIEKIRFSENEKLLLALEEIISSNSAMGMYQLSCMEQNLLKIAEEDIKYGRVISEEELDANDSEWMKEEE